MVDIKIYTYEFFTGGHPSVQWLRAKHSLESHESSVSLYEKEFNCKVHWEDGHCFLEFNDEKSYIWFIMRWQ